MPPASRPGAPRFTAMVAQIRADLAEVIEQSPRDLPAGVPADVLASTLICLVPRVPDARLVPRSFGKIHFCPNGPWRYGPDWSGAGPRPPRR
ncbi:MAG TPA: hypothetical protein VGS06_01140 [Streptosporangiaceae bacterium]|nr:hypothetical protein [Streptosporangiaceae bacterium]